MKNEIWKDIIGYEGMYQVSNLGRIKSKERIAFRGDGTPLHLKESIMTPTCNTYLYARLRKDGKYKCLGVHRLVCQAFHPNPNNYPCVNHKDNNPLNNTSDNLEWCTHSYNNNYGTHSERLSDTMVEKYGVAIDVYSKYGVYIKSYCSIRDAVRDGFDRNSISQCCRGVLNSHKGLVFKYKGEPFSYKNRRGNVCVDKYNADGILVASYLTIADAALSNNIKKDRLLYMKDNKIESPIDGYTYKFE